MLSSSYYLVNFHGIIDITVIFEEILVFYGGNDYTINYCYSNDFKDMLGSSIFFDDLQWTRRCYVDVQRIGGFTKGWVLISSGLIDIILDIDKLQSIKFDNLDSVSLTTETDFDEVSKKETKTKFVESDLFKNL